MAATKRRGVVARSTTRWSTEIERFMRSRTTIAPSRTAGRFAILLDAEDPLRDLGTG